MVCIAAQYLTTLALTTIQSIGATKRYNDSLTCAAQGVLLVTELFKSGKQSSPYETLYDNGIIVTRHCISLDYRHWPRRTQPINRRTKIENAKHYSWQETLRSQSLRATIHEQTY